MTDHLTFDQLCDLADAPSGDVSDSVARAHLDACADCAARLAEIGALSAATARLPREIAPPDEVWTAISAELTPRIATRAWWRGASAIRLAAAGLLIAAGSSALTMLALQRERPEGATAPPVVARSTVQPEAADALPAQLASTEQQYTRSVDELRRALDERRDSLSTTTLATVERSLRVADSAIAEARDALQRDPANRVLAEIFASNYERKIDLLRRATELAPRT
jgi:hypothetical protein